MSRVEPPMPGNSKGVLYQSKQLVIKDLLTMQEAAIHCHPPCKHQMPIMHHPPPMRCPPPPLWPAACVTANLMQLALRMHA